MADFEIQTTINVEVFPDVVDRVIDSPNGPVGQVVERVAQRLLIGARNRIGSRYSGHHPGPLMKDTGKVVPVGGAAYAVVFDHPKAFLHHEGKRSGYPIGDQGQRLSNRNDPSRSQGGPFFAIGPVTWKGETGGNPFLLDEAKAMGLRQSGSLLRGNRPTKLFRLRPL